MAEVAAVLMEGEGDELGDEDADRMEADIACLVGGDVHRHRFHATAVELFDHQVRIAGGVAAREHRQFGQARAPRTGQEEVESVRALGPAHPVSTVQHIPEVVDLGGHLMVDMERDPVGDHLSQDLGEHLLRVRPVAHATIVAARELCGARPTR